MRVSGGASLIAAGTAFGLLAVFVLWRRLPERTALAIMGVCGAAIGAGALLVQDRASAGDWVLAVGVLAFVTPLHARLVFGRPGGSGDRTVVASAPPSA